MKKRNIPLFALLFPVLPLLGQSGADTACSKCEQQARHFITIWDSVVSNHEEVKLVGYRKRYNIPADTIAIKQIYDHDSAYTGYNYSVNGDLKVKLIRLRDVYNKQIVEEENGDRTVMSFGSKPDMEESLARGIQISVSYYDLIYLYKGKEIILPALCSRGGYFITSILLSPAFFRLE